LIIVVEGINGKILLPVRLKKFCVILQSEISIDSKTHLTIFEGEKRLISRTPTRNDQVDYLISLLT